MRALVVEGSYWRMRGNGMCYTCKRGRDWDALYGPKMVTAT
jgi:hypothetical protein